MLEYFLKKNVKPLKTEKVVISERFTNEKGEPIPWIYQELSGADGEKLFSEAILSHNNNPLWWVKKLAVYGFIEPNLKDPRLLEAYAVKTPEELIDVMLTGEEYGNLFAFLTPKGNKFFNRPLLDDVKKAKN